MTEMSKFARTIMEQKYSHNLSDGKEDWGNIAYRVTRQVMRSVGYTMRDKLSQDICKAITARKFIPAGRYLYAAGRPRKQVCNCICLGVHDSREGWAELLHKAAMSLMTGAGIGVDYSEIRAEGKRIRGTGGQSTGPLALMQIVNETGRHVMQGGARRSAMMAVLRWDHPDIQKFISLKNWSKDVRRLKGEDFNFPATMDCTNISVRLNDEFFLAYNDSEHQKNSLANNVYWATIDRMLRTGEPGFAINTGPDSKEFFTNACSEFRSEDSDDICDLGSLNLARIDTLEEFEELVELATVFLLAGTIYTDLPYPDVGKVQSRNRRIGLGLMGIYEWLAKRGKSYGPDDELWRWLLAYRTSTKYANSWADEFEIKRPKKSRAIAPTGTISIVAETTSGIEPIFCVAYKRRYLKGTSWCYQYVVDPTAKRLIESGIRPEAIEDAYDLATDVERRVAFQAWVQQVVDMSISSTINLPHWGSELNNSGTVRSFGNMLMKYLPQLRGITVYPDGARGGQPLTPVTYEEAMEGVGKEVIEEAANVCELTKGGSCGD